MDEFKFALKCLISAVVIVMALQIHVGSLTIENHAQTWMD